MAEKKETKDLKELVYIQSNLKAPKNQHNKFGGYNYRSCEDIMEAVKPLLKDVNCTLTVSDDIVQVGDRIYVKATARLITPSGDIYENTSFAREAQSKKGMDDSQVTGATSSYARKYALNGLFCIDDTKDADALNVNKEFTQSIPSGSQSQQQNTTQQQPFIGAAVYDAELAQCVDINALMAVWAKYPQLQQDKAFRDSWAAKRTQLEGK